MRTTHLRRCGVAGVLLLLVVAAPAWAGPSDGGGSDRYDFDAPWHRLGTLYVGLSLGLDTFGDHIDAHDDGSITVMDDDGQSTVRGARLGFRGRHVGLEFGFLKLGQAGFTGTSSGGPSWSPGAVGADITVEGWSWSVLGRYPFTDRWAALARAGGLSWSSRETLTQAGGFSEVEDDGHTATLGLGVEYDVHRPLHTVLRAEWNHYRVGDDSLDLNAFTVGVEYHL